MEAEVSLVTTKFYVVKIEITKDKTRRDHTSPHFVYNFVCSFLVSHLKIYATSRQNVQNHREFFARLKFEMKFNRVPIVALG